MATAIVFGMACSQSAKASMSNLKVVWIEYSTKSGCFAHIREFSPVILAQFQNR
jgi:hypothetical protein